MNKEELKGLLPHREPMLLLDEAEQDTWLAPDTPLPALISLLAKPQPNLRSVALAGFVNKPETDGPECLTPA